MTSLFLFLIWFDAGDFLRCYFVYLKILQAYSIFLVYFLNISSTLLLSSPSQVARRTTSNLLHLLGCRNAIYEWGISRKISHYEYTLLHQSNTSIAAISGRKIQEKIIQAKFYTRRRITELHTTIVHRFSVWVVSMFLLTTQNCAVGRGWDRYCKIRVAAVRRGQWDKYPSRNCR